MDEYPHESDEREVDTQECFQASEKNLLRDEERSYSSLATSHSVKEVPFSPTGKYLTFSDEPFAAPQALPVASRSADLVAGAFVYLFFCGLAAALFVLAVQSVIPLDVAEDAALNYLENGEEGLRQNSERIVQQTSLGKGLSPAESDAHLRGLYESLPVFVAITVVLFVGGIVFYFRWMQAGVAVNQRPRYRSHHSLN